MDQIGQLTIKLPVNDGFGIGRLVTVATVKELPESMATAALQDFKDENPGLQGVFGIWKYSRSVIV